MNIEEYMANPRRPWILLVTGGPVRQTKMFNAFYSARERDASRQLRGKKMKTIRGLMDEFGAAFQFFYEFGENWHALRECLSYLDEWMPADRYVAWIDHAEEILSEESDPQQLRWFLSTLIETGDWWSQPVVGNDRFDRPSKSFVAVLRLPENNLQKFLSRVQAAGISTDFAIISEQ